MSNNNYNIVIIKNSATLIDKIKQFELLYQQNDGDRGGIMSFLSDQENVDSNIKNMELFGVKWDSTTINVIEIQSNTIVFEFITPTTYPQKFIDYLIKEYPESDIEVQFYGEGLSYFGKYGTNTVNNEYIEFNIDRDIMTMFNELRSLNYHDSMKQDLINYFLYLFSGKKIINQCFDICSNQEKILYTEGFLDSDNKVSKKIVDYYFDQKDKIRGYHYQYLLKMKKLSKKEVDVIIFDNDLHENLALLDNINTNQKQIEIINKKINETKNISLINVKDKKLAKNKKTPVELLRQIPLLDDKIVLLLIKNINCPFDVLRDIFYKTNNESFREEIKKHQNYKNVANEILKNMEN